MSNSLYKFAVPVKNAYKKKRVTSFHLLLAACLGLHLPKSPIPTLDFNNKTQIPTNIFHMFKLQLHHVLPVCEIESLGSLNICICVQ